jgi:hypothetical protein
MLQTPVRCKQSDLFCRGVMIWVSRNQWERESVDCDDHLLSLLVLPFARTSSETRLVLTPKCNAVHTPKIRCTLYNSRIVHTQGTLGQKSSAGASTFQFFRSLTRKMVLFYYHSAVPNFPPPTQRVARVRITVVEPAGAACASRAASSPYAPLVFSFYRRERDGAALEGLEACVGGGVVGACLVLAGVGGWVRGASGLGGAADLMRSMLATAC